MLKATKIIISFYTFPGTNEVLYLSMVKYYYHKYNAKKKMKRWWIFSDQISMEQIAFK